MREKERNRERGERESERVREIEIGGGGGGGAAVRAKQVLFLDVNNYQKEISSNHCFTKSIMSSFISFRPIEPIGF